MATASTTEKKAAAAEQPKKVKIYIPKVRPDEEDEFVCVNDRKWIVKKGVEVEVPPEVAEAIRNRDLIRQQAYENIAAHTTD